MIKAFLIAMAAWGAFTSKEKQVARADADCAKDLVACEKSYAAVANVMLWDLGWSDSLEKPKTLTPTVRTRIKKFVKAAEIEPKDVFQSIDSLMDGVVRVRRFKLAERMNLGGYSYEDANDEIMTEGTFRFDSGETHGIPIQRSMVRCSRSKMRCRHVTVDISHLKEDNFLNFREEEYGIETWDDDQVVTGPFDYECVRYKLRVERRLRTVRLYRTPISESEICKAFDKTEKVLSLLDSDASLKQWLNQEREKVERLSPRLKRLREYPLE